MGGPATRPWLVKAQAGRENQYPLSPIGTPTRRLSGHAGKRANQDMGTTYDANSFSDYALEPTAAIVDPPAQEVTTTAPVWTSMPTSKYPAELGNPGPFEKWIMFSAMSGRHVGRKGMAERNGADRPVASVELYVPDGALKSESRAGYDETDVGAFMGMMSEFTAQTNADFIGGVARGVTELTDIAIHHAREIEEDLGRGMIRGLPAAGWEATKAGGRGIASVVGSAFNTLGSLAKEAGAATVGPGGENLLRQAVFAKILDTMSNVSEGALEQLAGQRVNPRTDVLFNSMGYRTHDFNYMLIPRSLDEARAIDKIIHMFQFYMLPSYSPDIFGNIAGTMIGFPYEFEISFWTEAQAAPHHINKIGRSVLTSVAVDHTAGGNVAFYKGKHPGEVYPAATTLTLSFLEVRLLARDSSEINRGGMGPDHQVDPNARLTGIGMAALPGPGIDTSPGSPVTEP